MSEHDPTPTDLGFLEWVADAVMARIVQRLPPEERAEAIQGFREELGRALANAPMRQGGTVEEIAGRARIAAVFGATYGEEEPPAG